MNRRSFVQWSGLAAILAAVPITTACPAWVSNLYNSILKYVPVGLQAFTSIISILSGAGVIPVPIGGAIAATVTLVKAAFADLQTAVSQYQSAPAAQKQGLLGAISTALSVVEAHIQQFWNDLTIPDAQLAALVEGLLGVITSTLLGFGTQLPAPASNPASQARARLGKVITVTPPKQRSIKEFRHDFNSMLKGTRFEQHSI